MPYSVASLLHQVGLDECRPLHGGGQVGARKDDHLLKVGVGSRVNRRDGGSPVSTSGCGVDEEETEATSEDDGRRIHGGQRLEQGASGE